MRCQAIVQEAAREIRSRTSDQEPHCRRSAKYGNYCYQHRVYSAPKWVLVYCSCSPLRPRRCFRIGSRWLMSCCGRRVRNIAW